MRVEDARQLHYADACDYIPRNGGPAEYRPRVQKTYSTSSLATPRRVRRRVKPYLANHGKAVKQYFHHNKKAVPHK